jgi:hypothetical protein
MRFKKKPTSHRGSDSVTSKVLFGSGKERNETALRTGRRDVLALAITAAIVGFVGAIVVLTIPYAFLSTPLPPSVDRLGLSTETFQKLLFGRVWYLLVPSSLFALWIGFRSYRWGLKSILASPDETTSDLK